MAEYLGTKNDGTDFATQADLSNIVKESDTAPSSPNTGDLWFNTATGKLFIYYDGYWVEPASIGATGPQPDLATATPTTIQPDATGAAGSGTTAARADHTHGIVAAAPSADLTASTTNAEGSSTSISRADHSHAIATGTPGTIQPDDSAATGSSASLARADHTHAIVAAAPSANLTATTTNAEGSSTSFSRADHSHAVTTGSAGAITGSNATGTSASLARADHDHAYGNGSIATAALADGAVTAAKLNADTFGKAQTIDTKSDSYTLLTADAGKMIAMNKSTAQTVTINGSLDLAVGQRIDVIQTGAGQVTFTGSSATVNGTPGLKTRARYSVASVIATGTDTYVVFGDLAA